MLADLAAGRSGSNPGLVTYAGGRVYVVADDGVHGNELWSAMMSPGS